MYSLTLSPQGIRVSILREQFAIVITDAYLVGGVAAIVLFFNPG